MKHYSNQTFKITKELTAYAWTENTRYGFRHLITLNRNYQEIAKNKACYYNRTWERYEYESVLKGLAGNKSLSKKEKTAFLRKIDNQFRQDDPALKNLKTISGIMALGDIFGQNQTEKNDWKSRMLKAGLENKGLIMPDDWDTVDEDTKQKRLDGVIDILGSKI